MFTRNLNLKCASEMDDLLEQFDNLEKRLSRPVKDLDDVRSHMDALQVTEGLSKSKLYF
jgi:dynein heavy chain